MNILIVTANPSSQGRVHTIAEAYKESKVAQGHQVEILNLYTSPLQLPFLSYEHMSECGTHPNVAPLREKITQANELVFIHPVWWSHMPAIMKNFIDHVFGAHYAFKYENGKPVGMLQGKNVRVILTAGSSQLVSTLLYATPLSPLRIIWQKLFIEYCGMKMLSYSLIGGLNLPNPNPQDVTDFIEKVKKCK